jgi:hypothetical protein
MPAGCCFTPDHDDEDLSVRSLNHTDRTELAFLEPASGCCFTPDHEADNLVRDTLNPGDGAALAPV